MQGEMEPVHFPFHVPFPSLESIWVTGQDEIVRAGQLEDPSPDLLKILHSQRCQENTSQLAINL